MEFKEIELDENGNVLPEKTDKIALIDADTLVFGACLNQQEIDEILPRDFYTDGQWKDLTKSKIDGDVVYMYDEVSNVVKQLNLVDAFNYAKKSIQSILDRTGCKDYELHFTGSHRNSFRYTKVDNNYKANRLKDNVIKQTPAGLVELKEMFKSVGKGFIWEDYEADDIVVAKKRKCPDTYVLCAVDKDVLYSVPGKHFNYYKSQKYSIDMKWIEVSEYTAIRHHYIQTLTGDSGDNVIGLHRVGKKTAEKILYDTTNEEILWELVVKAYEVRGRNIFDAIKNMRLVNMHQVECLDCKENKFELKLWVPKGDIYGNN